MIDFQKRLNQLRNRPPKYLINVQIRNYNYQLQVYLDQTLKSIVQRYKDNGYFKDNNVNIKLMLNGQQENNVDLTIQNILNGDSKKKIQLIFQQDGNNNFINNEISNIKKQRSTTNTTVSNISKLNKIMNQPIGEASAQVRVSRIQSNKQVNQIKINVQQLKEIIDKLQKKIVIQQKYKGFSNVLQQKYLSNNNNNNSNTFVTKTNEYLDLLIEKQFQVLLKKIQKQKFKEIQNLNDKFKKLTFQMLGIGTNNKFLKQLLTKFNDETLLKISSTKSMQQSETKKKKKKQLNNDYGIQQKKILQNVQKIINNLRNERIKTCAIERQEQLLKQQNEKLKQQIKQLKQKLSSQSIQKLNKQSLELQKLMQTNTFDKKLLKISTNFLNQNIFQDQTQNIIKNIEKYENQQINQFQHLLSIRGSQYNMENILKLIELISGIQQNTRIMLLVGTSTNNILMAYSKGLDRQVKGKLSATRNQQKPLKSVVNQIPNIIKKQQQNGGFGFVMQVTQKQNNKIFPCTLNSSLIRYDNMFMYLTNCFRIIYSMKSKLQLQIKENKKGQLIDENNQLQYILGKTNKQIQINKLELFIVKFCDQNSQKMSYSMDNKILDKYLVQQTKYSISMSNINQKRPQKTQKIISHDLLQ